MVKKRKDVKTKSIESFFKKPKPATSEDTSQQHGTNVASGENPSVNDADVNMNEGGVDVNDGHPETNSNNPTGQNGEEEGMFDAANLFSLVGDENNYSESGELISASPEQKHIVTSMAITGSVSHRAIMGAVVQVCSTLNVDFSAASATEKAVLIERAEDHLRATHGLVVESQVIDGGARMDGESGEADLREAITVSRFEQALQGSPAFQALEIVCGQLCSGGSVTAGLDGLHDPTLGEMLKRKVDLSLRLTHSPHFNEMPCGGVDNIIGNILGMKIGNEHYQSLANGLEDMMRNCLQIGSLQGQPSPLANPQAPNNPTTRPVVIDNFKPSPQFDPSLHDKVVSKTNRAQRDEYLAKYGPVALAILEKAFAVFGEDIFGFHHQRLLSVLQGSLDMDTPEVFAMCWRIMEAEAFLSSEQLATVHDPEPNRSASVSLPTLTAAILFHCLGKHMALSRLTKALGLRLLSEWIKPGTYYRNEDGGRFKTCGVRPIGNALVTFSGVNSLAWKGNTDHYKRNNKNNGVYRSPTSDEISYIISTLIPLLVQVQDGETIEHYYTDDNEPFVTFQSSGGIVLRVAIAKLYRNVSPVTGAEIKGRQTKDVTAGGNMNVECIKGSEKGVVYCIEFTNIGITSDGYVDCSRGLKLHSQVGNRKLFHFKAFKNDVAATEHMPGIRSCYLADCLEPLGHGRDNHVPHRTNPGRFLDPDNGERGNALHCAPMGYVARTEAGGPRVVDDLPTAQVREGHPWYQLYLAWSAARSA